MASSPDAADPAHTLPDSPPDPAQVADIIRAQRAAVRDAVEPDPRILFGAWGGAWLVGYLALYASARTAPPHTPAGWSFVIFFALLAIAMAVTMIHVVRRTAGLAGPTGRSGAMYGWAWTIGFVAIFFVMTGLIRAGADPAIISLGWNALPCLLAGLLYLAGGAMWQSTVLYVLGGWIALVGGGATLAGLPATFLVMAFAGGGGMLLATLAVHVLDYRGSRRPLPGTELGGAA